MATNNLKALREMGFLIALDDFGSGYSSLKYLTNMPVDIVKFDISLIEVLDQPEQYNMISSMVTMISEMGYEIVAEGLENKETLEKVIAVGFDYGQGYHFGKPKPLS